MCKVKRKDGQWNKVPSSPTPEPTVPLRLTSSTQFPSTRLCGLSEGRANGAELDVGEDDSCVWRVGLDVRGLAGGDWAGTTGDTRLGWVGIGGEGRVEPEHVDRVVVPERHDQDVAAGKRGSHSVETTERLEGRSVAKDGLLGVAESIGNGVASHAGNGGGRVLVRLAVLDVEALDLAELRAGADELGDDCHLLGGVEGGAGAIEVLNTHAVAVEIATVLVADTSVAVVAITAGGASALLETCALAGMGSVGGGDGVSLPDIHLWAASTDLASSSVGVVG